MADTNTGRFVWYELMTTDPKAAIDFYTHVVGWKVQAYENAAAGEGSYPMLVASQGPIGGVMTLPEDAKKMGAPPHWMAHVTVEDVDATVAKAQRMDARVYVPPTDIPDIGRFSIIADPFGATISVFRPLQPMAPHDTTKHGEFIWHELITLDAEKALGFYGEIFGWRQESFHDMGPMGKYILYGQGGRWYGGMMTKTPDMPMPPAFVYYIQVDDLDAALGRAKERGARVIVGPMDVPGGTRVVQLLDPQGAMFALHAGIVQRS